MYLQLTTYKNMKKTVTLYLLFLFSAFQISAQSDYTNGIFILNEDWFGHNNSTINFLNTDTKEFDYLIIQNNESNKKKGLSLGCTSQFGTIYGDNMYIISKQNQDPGEKGTNWSGGRVVVADAKTMEIKKSIPVIYEIDGKPAADGRSFVGVDEKKGYIGTSNGIFIFDLQTFEIKKRIEGTENPLIVGGENNADGVGALYKNQIGMMIRTHDYVFAIQQDKGVLVIDPEKDEMVEVIEGCFSSMTQSKDGSIWVGRNSNLEYQTYPYGVMGSMGEKWEGNELLKIDPKTLETKIISMTAGAGLNQTWYAWTAGSLCASAKHNRLYFTFNSNKWSWFTTSEMFMYDIDNDTFSKIYESEKEERYFYGASIRINPLDDKLYASLYLDNVNQTYFFYQLNNQGEKLTQYTPIKRYWFPSLFIFPDNHAPVVADFPPVEIGCLSTAKIDLSSMATDVDNINAAITKKVISVENENLLSATVKADQLLLIPQSKEGKTNVVVRFNSNGKTVDKTLTVNIVKENVGVDNRPAEKPKVFVQNAAICITGLIDQTDIVVFDMFGRPVYSQKAQGEISIKNLPKGQLYIVSVKNNTYKIIL